MDLKAVGCHVFAGGFTMGVKRVMPCDLHLEVHGFGTETARDVVGVEVINCDPREWPKQQGSLLFGNPRCTAFSCITSGYDDGVHGPWAKQTVDIHQLVDYAMENDFDVVCWESVQQAFTGQGRALVDWLVETKIAPKGYRVAHLLLNAASFGNAQQRKRYFFVAYRRDKTFNVQPPEISPFYSTVYDAIWHLQGRETREDTLRSGYDGDCYVKLTPNEKHCLENLPNGWNLNMLGRWNPDALPPKMRLTWNNRSSKMPFSLHCIHRLQWLRPMPTIHSNAGRWIHPFLQRPITVREVAAAMGWRDAIPRGRFPIPQIAKGIVPDIGEWLAQQVVLHLTDAWGGEDWESSYDANNGEWIGKDTHGQLQKTFDLTKYVGSAFDVERYDYDARVPRFQHNVDARTGRLIRPWAQIAESCGSIDGTNRVVGEANGLRANLLD